MIREKLHSCPELIDCINEVGFLPLLRMGVPGWSAEEVMDEECQYRRLPDGGWEWLLWEWKGAILQESGCAYGKFFNGKAAFVSRAWWPDFCNYRRSVSPEPGEGSIERSILDVLKVEGSLITRDLRAACGFTGPKMRSRFDGYVTRLEMGGYIVTEDFVYPPRPPRAGVWLGLVAAHHTRDALRPGGLSSGSFAAGVAGTDSRPTSQDPAQNCGRGWSLCSDSRSGRKVTCLRLLS